MNQIVALPVPAEDIARDPVALAAVEGCTPNPATLGDLRAPGEQPRPGPDRPRRPRGDRGGAGEGNGRPVTNPADRSEVVDHAVEADAAAVGRAVATHPAVEEPRAAARAAILSRAADLYEAGTRESPALTMREAGETLADGVAEIREAVDLVRDNGDEVERAGDAPARGTNVCISLGRFPLAIFTGAVAAALAAGNAVLERPAAQTPLIAAGAVDRLHEAGVPGDVLLLLPGDGPSVGAPLTADPRIAGVCFTGPAEVARPIDREPAETAPHGRLIAGTGGLNAMIVGSTALLEQATRDIVRGAFQSAGQRCSALRVLHVQKDVKAKRLGMLSGAMGALTVGDPWDLATDVAPVIDAKPRDAIRACCEAAGERPVKRVPVPEGGLCVAPAVIRVPVIEAVEREIFGPVLHVAPFDRERIEAVVAAVDARG